MNLRKTSVMRAVSDTSPISALASIGRLAILQTQFSEIWIPTAVADELKFHPDPLAVKLLQSAVRENWIRSASPQKSHLLSVLLLYLHRGEAEAIALAAEMRAHVVLIDEQEGRRFAEQAGLSVAGVLGILLRAKLQGDIPLLK